MTTIKSYTDIPQSKKLAEILPLESADMCYRYGDADQLTLGKGIYENIEDWFLDGRTRVADIPCWSLAALLEIIPSSELSKMVGTNKWEISAWNDSNFELLMRVEGFDNSIDACYEMILKLHELNLL